MKNTEAKKSRATVPLRYESGDQVCTFYEQNHRTQISLKFTFNLIKHEHIFILQSSTVGHENMYVLEYNQ